MNQIGKYKMDYQQEAKSFVVSSENGQIRPEDLYVVWFCKTLQNFKALISTDVLSGVYWEVTFNGNKSEAYIDRYEKAKNTAITAVR